MKIIKTKLHGMFDYSLAFALVSPWLINFHQRSLDTEILALTGLILSLVNLFTDYELGLIRIIPMKAHLILDAVFGLFLIGLPFILPMPHYNFYWPVMMGGGVLLVVLLSSSKAYDVSRNDLNITTRP